MAEMTEMGHQHFSLLLSICAWAHDGAWLLYVLTGNLDSEDAYDVMFFLWRHRRSVGAGILISCEVLNIISTLF
jgi:hypothetical protein